MSTNVHLTPALEAFARECVDSGRYNNVSEVMRAALRLLQEREEARRQFDAMLEEVEAEVAREGTIPIETVLAEIREIVREGEKARRRKSRRKSAAQLASRARQDLLAATRWIEKDNPSAHRRRS